MRLNFLTPDGQPKTAVRKALRFLEKEFKYQLEEDRYTRDGERKALLRYRNQEAGVQIEVEPEAQGACVELYIRRLVDGIPSPWRDLQNMIHLGELQIHTDGERISIYPLETDKDIRVQLRCDSPTYR